MENFSFCFNFGNGMQILRIYILEILDEGIFCVIDS